MVDRDPSRPVLFVCRGSVQEGLGHVMRSRAVARELARSHAVRFVVIGDESPLNLLARYGLDFEIVPGVEDAVAEFERLRPGVVVFDLLRFPSEHVAAFGRSAHLVSLSPVFDQLAAVDTVFHRTCVTPPEWEGIPSVRAGLQYAVLGEHVERIESGAFRKGLERRERAVAIAMGGADAANKTQAVLDLLKPSEHPLLLWVMLGEGYKHSYEELARSVRGSRHEIILAKTNDSMWRILQTCSLAILAGGITTYEAAYAGLPSINVLADPAHRFLLRELEDHGVCTSVAGDPAELGQRLAERAEALVTGTNALLKMHLASENLIDGLGAQRIALAVERECLAQERPA